MVRNAVKEDSKKMANIIVNGWKNAYRGLIDDEFLDNMNEEILSKNWERNILSQNEDNHICVYEENGKVQGIIRFGVPDDKEDKLHNAEIHVLYVETSLKRQGIGSKMFEFAKDYFKKNNMNNLVTWCLKGNNQGLNFYKKMGGKIFGERKSVVNKLEVEEYGIEYKI